MRDYSHGKVRAEKTRDIGSFFYAVRGKIYGMGLPDFEFTYADLAPHIAAPSAHDAAAALVCERI